MHFGASTIRQLAFNTAEAKSALIVPDIDKSFQQMYRESCDSYRLIAVLPVTIIPAYSNFYGNRSYQLLSNR